MKKKNAYGRVEYNKMDSKYILFKIFVFYLDAVWVQKPQEKVCTTALIDWLHAIPMVLFTQITKQLKV